MTGPRNKAYLLPVGWGEAVPHLQAARREEQEASASLLCRDLGAAKAALTRAAEAASRAGELLAKLAQEVEGAQLDGPVPDWED